MTDQFCIMGADPGHSGAISFYLPDHPELVSVEDLPIVAGAIDVATLADLIRQMRPNRAVIERVASMPKQGVASTFKFGAAYGALLGVVGALTIPSTLVAATKWKRELGLSADKEEARALALRTWPARSELFKRKKDHGRAEAALLALWGVRDGEGA
jgi:crossover junction endodeoxyribonuclease RuvC